MCGEQDWGGGGHGSSREAAEAAGRGAMSCVSPPEEILDDMPLAAVGTRCFGWVTTQHPQARRHSSTVDGRGGHWCRAWIRI